MGLDLWFREDVGRILAATQEAMRASLDAVGATGQGQGLAEARAYQQGFEDALRAVRMAFGLAAGGGASPQPVEMLDVEPVHLPVPGWHSTGRR
jgi:hypothetical protein